ncbi:MAG TPA: SDR family oxidoreductase [Polyangiaceae bacterium]|jgi:NADP-dependent 3-hydroxy acid dehydrogenase YdfG
MGQNVLITGTSSGFGNLTALALASRGHRVFATMRDPDGKNREHAARLRAVQGIEVLALDVTSEPSVDAAVASAERSAGHLDAVVNNAGHAIIGLAETITPDQLLRLFDTNVVGVQRVNRAVLPAMRARRSGLLVHVSSGLGRIVIPVVALYGSTKFSLEAISDAYRYELKACGVDVTVVQPGAYPTELGSVDPDGADQARAKGYGALEGALEAFHKRTIAMRSRPDAPNPQEVADAIVKLIETPAGQRPARVAVDAMKNPLVPRLNEAHAQAQRELLQGMGMGGLAD